MVLKFKKRESVKEVEEGKVLQPKFDEKNLIPVSQSTNQIMKF